MNFIKKDINELKYANYNPRKKLTPDDKEYQKIKNSIEEFGYVEPIIINKDNTIIGGHQRLTVLKDLGYEEVDVIQIDIDKTKEKALNIALNKITGEWDYAMLGDLLLDLDSLNYDLEFTGFDLDEIENILAPIGEEKEVVEDDFDIELPEEPKAKYGDIYQLGKHRLMCGDSTKEEDVTKLMNGNKADMVFTDPPYNVDYSNADRPNPSKTNLGKIENDKMDEEDFLFFLQEVYKRLDENTKENSSFYIWYASKETIAFYKTLCKTNIKINQQIIWKKPMLLGRGKYQWAHEPCIFAIKGSPYFTKDRTKTTVWDFGGYDKSKNMHPTQKPLFLPFEAINNSSKEKDIVLDLFGGSGSTLIACEQLNRKCYMMELDPKYVDVIINRWETFTGKKAIKLN